MIEIDPSSKKSIWSKIVYKKNDDHLISFFFALPSLAILLSVISILVIRRINKTSYRQYQLLFTELSIVSICFWYLNFCLFYLQLGLVDCSVPNDVSAKTVNRNRRKYKPKLIVGLTVKLTFHQCFPKFLNFWITLHKLKKQQTILSNTWILVSRTPTSSEKKHLCAKQTVWNRIEM